MAKGQIDVDAAFAAIDQVRAERDKAEADLARLREAVELALRVRKDFQPEKAYGTSPGEAMEMVIRWALKGDWGRVDHARSFLSNQGGEEPND